MSINIENKQEQKNSSGKIEKSDKRKVALIILVAAAILLIYFSTSSSASFLKANISSDKQQETLENECNDDLESSMEQKLSLIKGAGKVKVIVSYEYSKELVPATVSDVQTSVSQDDAGNSSSKTEDRQDEIVTIRNSSNDTALILKEKSAVVKGVVVIAMGADDIRVKMDLLNAVCTLLDIPPEKVEVYEMNKDFDSYSQP